MPLWIGTWLMFSRGKLASVQQFCCMKNTRGAIGMDGEEVDKPTAVAAGGEMAPQAATQLQISDRDV
jgi:hypothetical protein